MSSVKRGTDECYPACVTRCGKASSSLAWTATPSRRDSWPEREGAEHLLKVDRMPNVSEDISRLVLFYFILQTKTAWLKNFTFNVLNVDCTKLVS